MVHPIAADCCRLKGGCLLCKGLGCPQLGLGPASHSGVVSKPYTKLDPPVPLTGQRPDTRAFAVALAVRRGNGPLDRYLIRLNPYGAGALHPPLGSGAALWWGWNNYLVVRHFPSPAWGGVWGGGICGVGCGPPPLPLPTRGRGRPGFREGVAVGWRGGPRPAAVFVAVCFGGAGGAQ